MKTPLYFLIPIVSLLLTSCTDASRRAWADPNQWQAAAALQSQQQQQAQTQANADYQVQQAREQQGRGAIHIGNGADLQNAAQPSSEVICPICKSSTYPTGQTKPDVSGKLLWLYKCNLYGHEVWVVK
jgi:hypothetical protein